MNRKPPNPQQLLAWLNSHLPASAEPVHTVTTLASSTAYLSLLFKFSPSTNMQEAIIDPTEQFEAIHNFKLLAAALQKMGLQFAFSISKLAEGSRRQHLQLLRLFYNTFSEVKHLKEETAEARMQVSGNGGVIISAPQSPIHPVLSKQKKFEVTEEQLNQLYELRRKMKEIKDLSSEHCQDQKNPQSPNDHNERMQQNERSKTNNEKQIAHQHQNCQEYDTCIRQNNNFRLNNWDPKYLNNAIGKITFKLLAQYQQIVKFGDKFEQLRKEFFKDARSANCLLHLFTGNFKKLQSCNSIHDYRLFQEMLMKIGKLCEDFYQSAKFIKRILNSKITLKNKTIILSNLQIFSEIAKVNAKENISKQCLLSSSKKHAQLNAKRSVNRIARQQCSPSFHVKSKPFWSIHRKTLIAHQMQYISNICNAHQKKSKYRQLKSKKNIKGFLFQEIMGNSFTELAQKSKQHINLNKLFDETKNHSHQQMRLREFVKLMLELKHTCLLDQFMEVYDIIVKNIVSLNNKSTKSYSDLFQVTEMILPQINEIGKHLNEYLTNRYELKDGLVTTIRLLKVTIFCLLADMVQFKHNPYYREIFLTSNDIKDLNIQSSKETINSYFLSKCKQYTQIQKQRATKSLVKMITDCIKNNLSKPGFHKQIEYILLNCIVHKSGFLSLQYLFFGTANARRGHQVLFYDKTVETSKPFLKARRTIRKSALKQLRSSSFLRQILRMHNCEIESKLSLLRLLPMIQRLPTKQFKRDVFYSYFNQSHAISKNTQFIAKGQHEQNNRVVSNRLQIQSSWSDHIIGITAMEIHYIQKKFTLENKKYRTEKLQHARGFLFDSIQSESVKNNQIIPQLIKQHPNLKNLFQKDKESEQNVINLRSIVRTMLQIKEQKVISVFLNIYDIIVGQIVKTKLEDVRLHSHRFKMVDSIVQKLPECGDMLDHLLKDSYGLKEDPTETKFFLRVTVYCFLAEMHNFTINEFYSHVFGNQYIKPHDDETAE